MIEMYRPGIHEDGGGRSEKGGSKGDRRDVAVVCLVLQ